MLSSKTFLVRSQVAGLSLRRQQVQTKSWLRCQRATGSRRRSSYRLNIPDINGHRPSEPQRPLSWIHSAQRVKPHRSVLRGKTPQVKVFRLRPRKSPCREKAANPSQLKGQNFLHLRDTALNKPVKRGLDLPNMKTTGLKYNLALKERKCTKKAK